MKVHKTNMFKNLFKIFIASLFIWGCDNDTKNDKNILMVGVSADYPPFEFIKDGQITGLEVELIKEIGKRANWSIEVKDMPFASLIPALQGNKIDIAISGFNITPERQKSVDFSDIYYYNSLSLVYRRDNINFDKNNLHNYRLGAQLGSTLEVWAKKMADKDSSLKLTILDSNITLIEELRLNRIDTLVLESSQAREFCLHNKELNYVDIDAVEDGYVIAFKKGSNLVGKVNEIIQNLKIEGFIQALQDKWITKSS